MNAELVDTPIERLGTAQKVNGCKGNSAEKESTGEVREIMSTIALVSKKYNIKK
jgi:hypothetical protein